MGHLIAPILPALLILVTCLALRPEAHPAPKTKAEVYADPAFWREYQERFLWEDLSERRVWRWER